MGISRNASQCIHRSLSSISLHQLTKHPFRLFHSGPEIFHHRPLALPQAEIRLNRGWQSSAIYHRYLCSSTSTVNQANSGTNGSSEGSSGKGEKSNQSQDNAEQGKPVRGGPVSWLSFLLLFATGGGVVFYYDQKKKRHIEGINSASTAVKEGPSVGKAAIGGPFNLIDHNGKAVTDRDFRGKWSVIYFGFTYCPDICPDELQKLAAAVDKIKEKAGIEIVPIFISVDPERDTVEQVHEYVKEFHPSLIGLTGDPDEVKKAARAFRVYYMKTEEEDSDYLVDHSIIMYLMDPNMEFVKFYGKNYDIDTLANGIVQEIRQHKKLKA
ncbi:Protein SCO1 1 like [Actinidia chinensis var. chinensis]|uniref:Protein SCO1 1 like n=1 Tax=Actinidia chinensis var. chinensis TaxID=1590841 RepID=A0A2R6R8F0_ACTCC|nr:Protein SCO1 1 like [Actinidia chinensis var. chinensis]